MRTDLLSLVALTAVLLVGCRTNSDRTGHARHDATAVAVSPHGTPTVDPDTQTKKDLLKRVAKLSEAEASAVLTASGLTADPGISTKFTLAKIVNNADSATLKTIAAHMPEPQTGNP
jgi:hypothetical protein